MTQDELAELLRSCPVLYHMAAAGAWPGIQAHGLCSTAALLTLCGVTGPRRLALERAHRPACVSVPSAGAPVTLRDQSPMTDAALRRCLQDGLTPADWYGMLNARVFFWLSHDRLLRLLGGRQYRNQAHDVLEIDSAALFGAYHAQIELSPINSGATFALGPAPRGLQTFRSLKAFDYAARRAKHPAQHCAVEATIPDRIPDISRYTQRVIRMQGPHIEHVIHQPTPSPQPPHP